VDPESCGCVKWYYGTIRRIPQDMVMELTILGDLYYLDDDEETERTHQFERPSKDDITRTLTRRRKRTTTGRKRKRKRMRMMSLNGEERVKCYYGTKGPRRR
jgi:hypothetical protein